MTFMAKREHHRFLFYSLSDEIDVDTELANKGYRKVVKGIKGTDDPVIYEKEGKSFAVTNRETEKMTKSQYTLLRVTLSELISVENKKKGGR